MKRKSTTPPGWAIRFFKWLCNDHLVEAVLGDMIELYQRRRTYMQRWRADILFILNVVQFIQPFAVRKKSASLNSISMYKNYITIAWRTFRKSTGYSFINIAGLAVGLSACLLIGLYVQHELSFDNFHEKGARVFRVNMELKFGDNHLDLAVANPLFGETAKTEIQEVETFTRLQWYGSLLVKKGNENIKEENVAWADSTLFDVFTLPMISGNPKTALTEPHSIVVTESVARKYFDNTDVVGETLTINNTESRKITGVIKDLPSNMHIRFTSFVPIVERNDALDGTWAGSQNWNTYLLLKQNANANEVVPLLNKMLDRHLGPQLQQVIGKSLDEFNSEGNFFKTSLTPLHDIYLYSNRIGELYGVGNIQYVYIFSAIAACILIIAIINFMNLATARSANRAREVGMRKVMGSMKGALIAQFITESVLTCTAAMVIAVAITVGVFPVFNELTGKALDVSLLMTPTVITGLIVLALLVGIISGSYPAFYLSAFQPVSVLKGAGLSGKRSSFRNVLVVFQFAASILLIASTLIVFRQLQYIQHKDIGYERNQVVTIYNIDKLGNRAEALKTSLRQVPGIENATVTGYLPVNYYRSTDSFFTSPLLDTKDMISMQEWKVDEDYLATMGMQLVEGRNFSKDIATDSSSLIINEAAAKFLGGENVLEKKLYNIINEETRELKEFRIIGIVKDFNFSSLRETVKPLAFVYGLNDGGLSVRLAPNEITKTLSTIENTWKTIATDIPFEYSFMDADFDRLYRGERQTGKLITYFATLSILISCLGLFGLATFMTEQRNKEIGIRKVMGATVPGITALLSKDFLKLVLFAIVIAIPIAWYFTGLWLQDFAYHIELEWWLFALAGVVALLIALLTVSVQAIKAAVQNPVTSLRQE
ncbi:MAG: ABC transporter permease [Cyclobacteriaceae bacterium]|nr:ABC transporter permease [Cyclobacteriaceae bacterium]